jgi:hypothetical protein
MKRCEIRHFFLVLLGYLIGSIVAFSIASFHASASASPDESRLSRLESEMFQLKNEVNQLSSQIRSLDRVGDRPRPNPVEVPTIAQSESSTLANDPMFDRLATLVIELKQRMDRFDERLVQLE